MLRRPSPRPKPEAAKVPIPRATGTGKRTDAASISDAHGRRRRPAHDTVVTEANAAPAPPSERGRRDEPSQPSTVTAHAGVPVADHHGHDDPPPDQKRTLLYTIH